jgi:hypothetical protein
VARFGSIRLLVAVVALAGTSAAQQISAVRSTRDSWRGQGAGSYSLHSYTYDDGSAENSIGITNCPSGTGTVCWIHRFDAEGGADTIATVSTAWGSALFPGFGPPPGTAAFVAVWGDPDQDGNPTNANLLALVATTVENPDTDLLQTVAIPPTPVSGIFFVGAICDTVCTAPAFSTYPAPLDMSTGSLGRAWICAANTAPFDPSSLASNSLPPVELGSIAFHGVFLLRAHSTRQPATPYCSARVNSLGCRPTIGSYGVPSASATNGFVVTCGRVLNQQRGILAYGFTGSASTPFFGGTLCVAAPVHHSVAVPSGGGSGALDCSGAWVLDVCSFAHGLLGGTPQPGLTTPGQSVWAQWWGRDPGFPAPNDAQLSAGLTWTMCE